MAIGEGLKITDEHILADFNKLSSLGVIEYVLPSVPLGESWLVGLEGHITKMDGDQATCFLLGSAATANYIDMRLGIRKEDTVHSD